MTAPAISYERWKELLADRFFLPEYAGTHVMFFVDDACVAELAQRDSDAAVTSLVEAIVPKLRRSVARKLFAPIVSATAAWKAHGEEGPRRLYPCLRSQCSPPPACSALARRPPMPTTPG